GLLLPAAGGCSKSSIFGAPVYAKPSVFPGIIRPGRRVPSDGFRHDAQQLRLVQRSPAVALHRPAVFERPAVSGAGGAAKKILKLVDGKIQVEVIHIAAIKVQLAHQPRTDHWPIFLEIIAEIVVVVTHVDGDRGIDFPGELVPQWLRITIWPGRSV